MGLGAQPGPARHTRRRPSSSAVSARPGPTCARTLRRLVGLFVTIVYGQRGFKEEVLPRLRQFWLALQGG